MTGYLWAALGVVSAFGMAAIGDMVSEEVRDRLDHLPQAILRLAARRLDPDQWASVYEEVWLTDLAYFLKGDKARPVTRLVHGTSFALGILVSAHRIARHQRQRVVVNGLDYQIAVARTMLDGARAMLREVEAVQDQQLLQRFREDLAANECILDNLLSVKRWVDGRR